MYTTLNKIRAAQPCQSGWTKLLSSLNKTKADDEQLALSSILVSNGLYDTLWCFRAVAGFEREKRLFAVACARQVQHIMKDQRSIAALDVAERYANGLATQEELDNASRAAYEAADAAYDAYAADAAYYAAEAADAAYEAADAARTYAAYAADAAYDAYKEAYVSARKKQEEILRNILKETEKM